MMAIGMGNKKNIVGVFFLVLILLITSGCKSSEVKQPAIISINSEEIYSGEIMLYILQVKSEFEELGGQEVWEIEDFSGGKTAEEVAKEGALENLIRIKILSKKSQEMGINLTDKEKDEIKELALDYYYNLNDDLIENYKITYEIVEQTFLETKISNKVLMSIKESYEPSQEEIDKALYRNEEYSVLKDLNAEDILTQVIVKQILIKTTHVNNQGKEFPFTEKELDDAYNLVNEAHKKALNNEDFDELILKYSQDDNEDKTEPYIYSKALLENDFKQVIEGLEVGEISNITKTDTGYYFFKLIGIVKPTQEDINSYKEYFLEWEKQLQEEYRDILKEEAFEQIYKEWKKESEIKVYTNMWNDILI